ncbi:MAG: ankyrin repeat domain-containing protein [Bdellovibrionales bacterium]|nr:ankyrin repeat domain-containing protein [Bdellovibrionales bacterium]
MEIRRVHLVLPVLTLLTVITQEISHASPASERNAALAQAAGRGRVSEMRELLEQGASPNARDRWGETALFLAAQQGSAEGVSLLIAAGAQARRANAPSGATPLMGAAEARCVACFDAILAAGGQLLGRDSQGRSLIHHLLSGSPYVVGSVADRDGLLERVRAEFRARPGRYRGRDLFTAIKEGGSLELIGEIIANGVSVETREPDLQYTPVIVAARACRADAVRDLLERGANVAKRDTFGSSALGAALSGVRVRDWAQCSAEIVGLVADAFSSSTAARYNVYDLIDAVDLSPDWALVRAILDDGVNVNARAHSGESALHEAARRGRTDFARRLLDAGARVNAMDSLGMTPLMEAVTASSVELVRELLARGANLRLRHSFFRTTAAECARSRITQLDSLSGWSRPENWAELRADAELILTLVTP